MILAEYVYVHVNTQRDHFPGRADLRHVPRREILFRNDKLPNARGGGDPNLFNYEQSGSGMYPPRPPCSALSLPCSSNAPRGDMMNHFIWQWNLWNLGHNDGREAKGRGLILVIAYA